MTTNKPPMTVWLETINGLGCGMWFDDNTSPGVAAEGPYVHLEQFLAEAKKRAKKTNRFLPEIIEIMQKEINEQTIPETKAP